jgi:phosphonate transport system permease protein
MTVREMEKHLTPAEVYEARPKNFWTRILIGAALLILVVWSAQGIKYNGIAAKGSEVAYGVFYGLVHPDQALLFNFTSEGVTYLTLQTIAIAVLGTVFGAILAIPVSFLSAENVVPKWLAFLFRALVLLIRTIPSLVWALVWIRVTGPGPFCGVVTQSICSIGMISKMYVTAIEDLDTGILDAMDACGCTTFQKIRCGILPQLSASFISTTIYRFDINLKDATTLGIVGAGGIGASLVQAINSRRWSMVGSYMFGLILLVLIIEWVSTKIRANLARGERG